MGKPVDTRVLEYVYDINWDFKWNLPIQEPEGLTGKYAQELHLTYVCRDTDKVTIKNYSEIIVLKQTDAMLSLTERLEVVAEPEIQELIISTVANTKLQLANYVYEL